MGSRDYEGIYYDEPVVQAQFEQLLQKVRDAEKAREPLSKRQNKAENDVERGTLSEKEYRSLEDAYIAASNRIAAAQREVEAFLRLHRNYRVR
jgi:hypothetical protein